MKPNAAILETLFVIATKSESVKAILDLKEESSDPSWCEVELEETPIEHALFVPCYQEKSIKATDLQSASFKMSAKNFKDLKEYFNLMSEKHFILKHEIYDPKDYKQFKDLIQTKRFKIELNWHYKDLDYMISEIKGKLYPNQKVPKDEFNALDSEKIVHFKRIKVKRRIEKKN